MDAIRVRTANITNVLTCFFHISDTDIARCYLSCSNAMGSPFWRTGKSNPDVNEDLQIS